MNISNVKHIGHTQYRYVQQYKIKKRKKNGEKIIKRGSKEIIIIDKVLMATVRL